MLSETGVPRMACIVGASWRDGLSGVSTFLRNVERDWKHRYECVFVERPAECVEGNTDVRSEHESQADARYLSLFLGYLRMLFQDVRFLRQQREQLFGRMLVVNEFGCETLPIALRLVFPRHRIVAIAHTRPGSDERACHPVRQSVERRCYHSVSSIVYNSESNRKEWSKKLGVARSKGVIIKHGIGEAGDNVPADYPRIAGDVVDFVCVSQLSPGKGHASLMAAWKRATEMCRVAIRLLLVGDGVCMADTERAIKDLGLASTALLLGSKNNGGDCFSGGDVSVLLATEPEAFGLVLLEAMSRGKAVLASDRGAIPEVVQHGETGLLVDPDDAETVAKAICRLAEDASERERMGERGRARWASMFTLERMLGEYERFFREQWET